MYSLEEIKGFITILEESSLSVLELQKEDGSKIRLEKPQTVSQLVSTVPVAGAAAAAPAAAPQSAPQPAAADSGRAIKAPIVGVFYAAPSPESEAYVSVGKKVKKGDTVCIIEAMKCMNEIQAEEDGEIVEVLVNNGDLVEYGQPLFKIK
ncbi:MAG: acetyl-CoA carboxylase biotin carboxyl carrier protein [Clostridiales bacterium]|nr:acetyl-CoA carboxylase biotin carboxyl carrier protein [Clostridiales bacterium]